MEQEYNHPLYMLNKATRGGVSKAGAATSGRAARRRRPLNLAADQFGTADLSPRSITPKSREGQGGILLHPGLRTMPLDARVRNLYKRILTVGLDYPQGLDHVRQRAKREFRSRAHVQGEELARAVNYGRYMVSEMVGVIQLKKYRAMKQRYEEE